jgi:hypothetical protein
VAQTVILVFSFRSTNVTLSPKAARSPRSAWLTGVLWASDPPAAQTAREATLMPIFRAGYAQEHGPARTLRDVLAQEGYVMIRSGCTAPFLDAQELAYTAAVVAPYLNAEDVPTLISCLFGDPASISLGYSPQGLREQAGLALALHQSRPNPSIQRTATHVIAPASATAFRPRCRSRTVLRGR